MMWQRTVTGIGFEGHHGVTPREQLRQKICQVVPWRRLLAGGEPYDRTGECERPPLRLERRWHLYWLQDQFTVADPSLEERSDDIRPWLRSRISMCVVSIRLSGITICRFHCLIDTHERGVALLADINAELAEHGTQVSSGAIGDATSIEPLSSSNNPSGQQDPCEPPGEQDQATAFPRIKRGFTFDNATKRIHTVVATSARAMHGPRIGAFVHIYQTRIWGDEAYDGQHQRVTDVALQTQARARTHDMGQCQGRLTGRHEPRIRPKAEHPAATIKGIRDVGKLCEERLTRTRHRRWLPGAWPTFRWREKGRWRFSASERRRAGAVVGQPTTQVTK